MIEIYNEIQHIQNVLEKGLGQKWRQDLTLLVKYWKSYPPYYKKKKVKEMAIQKCELYVPHFNPILQTGEVEKLVDNVWKNWKYNPEEPEQNSKLREISEIKISKEVLDWFLSLPTEFTVEDEELSRIKNLRKDLKIGEHPINYARARMLFTLYIWMLIQETFMTFPAFFKYDDIKNKLKKDAKLSGSFKMYSERNLLKDLGFLRMTEKESDIILEFQDKFDVFKIPLTPENTVVIEEKDLYTIRSWIDEQFKEKRYYTYTCECCGKEIREKRGQDARGRKKKYCPACALKLKNNVDTSKHYCEQCGKEIKHKATIKRIRKLCVDCQLKNRKKQSAECMKKLREKRKS